MWINGSLPWQGTWQNKSEFYRNRYVQSLVTFLVPGWTPSWRQNYLNSSKTGLTRCWKHDIRDFGPYWQDNMTRLLQLCQAAHPWCEYFWFFLPGETLSRHVQMCHLGGLQVDSLKKKLSTQLLQSINLLLDQREIWREDVKAWLKIRKLIRKQWEIKGNHIQRKGYFHCLFVWR